jgi:hypothetical protein
MVSIEANEWLNEIEKTNLSSLIFSFVNELMIDKLIVEQIGSYDKQQWEKTIEERILKGLNAIPKKVAKVKTELIDLDLIRGSAFTKAKPQQGWLAAIYSGINRVILLPFYLKWWKEQTNPLISALLLTLYSLQVISLSIYFENGLSSSEEFSEVPTSEVLMPIVMMLILGVIHTQIVGTKLNKNHSSFRSPKFTTSPQHLRKKKRKKKTKQSSEENIEVIRQKAKNGSDEESGLGSLDLKSDKLLSKQSLSERRGFPSIESLNLENSIPRIEIDERISGENSDISSDEFDIEDNSSNHYNWRRYSDSKYNLRLLKNLSENEIKIRRFSEGSKESKNKKFRETLRSKKRKPFHSLHLSPPTRRHHQNNSCSSCESEGTMSPTTPNTPTPVCIPTVNSYLTSKFIDLFNSIIVGNGVGFRS